MKPQPRYFFFIPPDNNNSNSVMAGGDTDGVTLKESNVRCIHSTSIIWHVWRRQNLRQHIICMCTKVLLVTILIETIEHRSIAFSHVPTAVIDSLATSWMSLMCCMSTVVVIVCRRVWEAAVIAAAAAGSIVFLLLFVVVMPKWCGFHAYSKCTECS